jgi:hypothetical protein
MRLRVVDIEVARDRIATTATLADLSFHVSVWYEDVDFTALPRDVMDRLAFHVAMFQLNALCSLRPTEIELGRYARFATPAFVELWQTVLHHVWAQWRFENHIRDHAPRFIDAAGESAEPARVLGDDAAPLLAFSGGGKDSLVAVKLLERAGLPFATLGYSHSIYGAADPQHALLDRVASRSARVRAERQWIFDDFLDSPVLRLRPELGIHTLTAAETPASVFAALPLALARGYRGLVVAHEAGASSPNLVWEGEPVNHQWGKGWEAEQLLADYVRTELLANIDYFSLLQPIHDEVIFTLLAGDAELAPLTHSCNIAKPWCGACAKCAYVWLQMAAHLPPAIVDATFAGADLGEREVNQRWFRELLGLAEHSPFECVGSPAEARLALAQLAAKRPLGPRLAALAAEIGPIDVAALAAPLVVVGDRHGMPPHVAAKVMPLLAAAARSRA